MKREKERARRSKGGEEKKNHGFTLSFYNSYFEDPFGDSVIKNLARYICIRLPQYEVKSCHKFSLSGNTFIIIIIIIIIINLLQIFFFNISGAEYIYFFQYFITCYLLLWFLTVFEPSAGFLFRNFCLFVFIRFLIFSQLDPADNSTWYWRVILDKYSIIIIIIIIIITFIIIIATENKKGGYMLLLNIYFSLSGFQSCLRSYLHPPRSEYLFSMRRRVTKT